jgi:dipeptidyl aminopeptidase/acylaminoacyl peptidase
MRTLLCLAAISAASSDAHSQQRAPDRTLPPLLRLEQLFAAPTTHGDVISPDGRWIAAIAPWQGASHLVLTEIASGRRRRVTQQPLAGAADLRWSTDGRRLLFLQDREGNEQFQLHTVDAQSGAVHAVTPSGRVETEIVALPASQPEIAVITLNQRTASLADAYRVNLRTRALELAAENPGTFVTYVANDSARVLVALGIDSTGEYALYHRRDERSDWRTVRRYAVSDRMTPLRMTRDGTAMLALSNADRDRTATVRLDLQTGAERVLHEDPLHQVDAEVPLLDPLHDMVVMASYSTDTTRTYADDGPPSDALARLHAQLPAGLFEITSHSRDNTRWLLTHSAPAAPPTTWLIDLPAHRATLLHRARPRLTARTLAPAVSAFITASDGLPLHVQFTAPRLPAAQPTPLVLLVHGGPWSRDRWEFQSDVQLFANRGYAVLQVNFRGSSGFGKRVSEAAKHEFAEKMHTDLLDGIRWAAHTHDVDSSRVAIVGGSYGGYAALVGLTFTPTRFRCGVDYAGSSSLVTLLEAFPPSWRPYLPRNWYRLVGDPRDSTQRADLVRRSPLTRADSARAPLLIFQGQNDPRVTRAQSDAIAAAFVRRGIPVTYLVSASDGHSFGAEATAMAVHRGTELFLQRCLGGRAQVRVSRPVTARLRQMQVDPATLRR